MRLQPPFNESEFLAICKNSFRLFNSGGLIVVITQTNPPTTTRFTLEEYRAMEETADIRHEYRNGEIITMPGGSEAHSAIASNLLIYLGFLLRDTNFRLYLLITYYLLLARSAILTIKFTERSHPLNS